MDWKTLFAEFVAKVETFAVSSDAIKFEIEVLTDLASKVEDASVTHPLAVKAEKFFFSAAIKYLQSKI